MEFLKLFSGRTLAWQSVVETVVEDRMIWSFFFPEWDMDLFLSFESEKFSKRPGGANHRALQVSFCTLESAKGLIFRWKEVKDNHYIFLLSGHVFDIVFVNFCRTRIGLDIIDIFPWCLSIEYFWVNFGYNLRRMKMSNPGGIDLTSLSNFFQKRLWEIPSIYIWWHSKKWPLRHSDEFLQ